MIKISTDLSRFIRALAAFGDLEWYRSPQEHNPAGQTQVRYIVWRYREPSASLQGFFRDVLAEVNLQDEWYFDASRRNWIYAPNRLPIGSDFSDIRAVIEESDQEYCKKSAREFGLILQKLEERANL